MRRHILAAMLMGAALLMACGPTTVPLGPIGATPAVPPGTIVESAAGSPNAATPGPSSRNLAPMGGAAMLDQMRQMRVQLQQVRAAVPEKAPDHHRQLAEQMANVMYQMGDLMRQMDAAMDGMSPEERRAVVEQLQPIQSTIQNMTQRLEEITSTPLATTPTPGQPIGLPLLSSEMRRMHERMRHRSSQIGQLHGTMAMDDMAELMAQMEPLIDRMTPALDRLGLAERRELGETMGRMQWTIQDMSRTLLTPTPLPATPTPTPTPRR